MQKETPPRQSGAWDIVFKLLAAAGILTALFGIGIEFLPGAHPGLNPPQILLIIASLLLSLAAFRLRRADARRRAWGTMRKHWLPGLIIAAATLIALEFVLGAVDGSPLYFPPDPPQELVAPRPWQVCDQAGCHYDHDAIVTACEEEEPSARFCIVNRQGFHDTQDFAASDDLDGRTRILTLGDSFTYGLSADIGSSYVETIESNLPQSIVWNTGISGAGTHHALAAFQVYAPVLQPHLTILGFFVNDFGDNLLPIDTQLWLVKKEDERIYMRRRYDDSGNAISLDELKAFYYRAHGLEPPANEIERLLGRTRLGSLLLRMIDIAQGESPDAGRDREVAVTRRYLRDLREAAAAQDTTLLVLLIPHPYDVAALTSSTASPQYVLGSFERLLRHRPPMAGERYRNGMQLMEELGIPYLNPIHTLDSQLDYAPKPDLHWNSAGHQKIGAMLSDCIEAFQVRQDLSDCEQVTMPEPR